MFSLIRQDCAVRIRLKKNAILLTTTNSNDTLTNWNNKSEYKINLIDDNTGLKFNNTNKKSTKDSNIESIDRYSIKNITSLDNFKKMVNGEDVVEEEKQEIVPVNVFLL